MGRLLGADKDTEKLVRIARREWGHDSVRLTQGNHLQFFPPGTETIIVTSLTGSQRAQRTARRALRKAGLTV